MPKTVIRIRYDQDDDIPAMQPRDGYLVTSGWFEQQHLGSPMYIHALEVVEEDDGSLTAYVERFDLRPRTGGTHDGPYLDPHGYASRHMEHFSVSSVQMLLDQFDVIDSREPVVSR